MAQLHRGVNLGIFYNSNFTDKKAEPFYVNVPYSWARIIYCASSVCGLNKRLDPCDGSEFELSRWHLLAWFGWRKYFVFIEAKRYTSRWIVCKILACLRAELHFWISRSQIQKHFTEFYKRLDDSVRVIDVHDPLESEGTHLNVWISSTLQYTKSRMYTHRIKDAFKTSWRRIKIKA